ncbi:MAG: hypothetical protein HRT44_08935 [Bdellovibrionales bacterium]|nr:hypothetical protein [Bdellovibrionales bacterium]NQZ19365.1 hypothetical protein [Bdellovibrionales bacterium]
MKKACLIALTICASALFVGCGSSSSDDNNGGAIQPQPVLDSSCINNNCQPTNDNTCFNGNCQGQTPVCNNRNGSIFNTASQTTCYPNNGGQYSESPFGFAGGACQCETGFMPFRQEDGNLGCIRRETTIQTNWLLTVSFSSGNISSDRNGRHRSQSWDENAVDFILNQGGSTIDQIRPGVGNCYQQMPIGCSLQDPYGSCAHVSSANVPAICVPANGGQGGQGICVQQNVPVR